jgi:pimeloyl-ACP methyl ester carboxylesterase
VRIHYRIGLPPDGHRGPPIVFVPGMTDLATDYDGIAEATGRRTIVVELRGHGWSDAPEDGYRLSDHVDDLDAVIDEAVGPGAPVHLMTFSRGTGYALGWVERHPGRVLSLAIGDYPAREIRIPVTVAESLMQGRWRGTPVSDRLDERAALAKVAASEDRPYWQLVAGLRKPVLVVRSTAAAPLNDDDWQRYQGLDGDIELVDFADSPHDIFRPDRTRYPQLVAALVERAESSVHP